MSNDRKIFVSNSNILLFKNYPDKYKIKGWIAKPVIRLLIA